MNHSIISREQIVNAAEDIVRKDGLNHLSIRGVAAACDISVGCIYNYFPSKSDLIFALVEGFWIKTFMPFMRGNLVAEDCFINFVESTYAYLYTGVEAFSIDFLHQLSTLSYNEKKKGREMEEKSQKHMKSKFIMILENDKDINSTVWNDKFSQEDFIDFVFDHMMINMRKEQNNCNLLLEIIKRTLY